MLTIKIMNNKKFSDIILNEYNPRKVEDSVNYVAAFIYQFKVKILVIIDKKNIIVADYTRFKATIKLGLD